MTEGKEQTGKTHNERSEKRRKHQTNKQKLYSFIWKKNTMTFFFISIWFICVCAKATIKLPKHTAWKLFRVDGKPTKQLFDTYLRPFRLWLCFLCLSFSLLLLPLFLLLRNATILVEKILVVAWYNLCLSVDCFHNRNLNAKSNKYVLNVREKLCKCIKWRLENRHITVFSVFLCPFFLSGQTLNVYGGCKNIVKQISKILADIIGNTI